MLLSLGKHRSLAGVWTSTGTITVQCFVSSGQLVTKGCHTLTSAWERNRLKASEMTASLFFAFSESD